ncbi:DUF2723 domain-containing protein [bacterium]|nr:DUF2723 domain-containing protein [bacterium]
MARRPDQKIGPSPTEVKEDPHPHQRWAALLSFVLPLSLYLWSLATTVTLEDSGEFLTAAVNLGVPHPPGYPLWCLLAHPFTWIPIGTMAERIHFFSALCGAGTCFFTQRIGFKLSELPWVALFGALMLAVSPSLWSQSTIAEVYSLNALIFSLAVWGALCFVDDPKPVHLQTLAAAVGFGSANHYLTPLLAIPLLLWVLARQPKAILRPAAFVPSILWFLLGLATYAYLPIRASANPVPNAGDPATWKQMVDHVLRRAYTEGSESIRFAESWTDSAQHAYHAMMGYAPAGFPILLIVGMFSAITLVSKRGDYLLVGLAIVLLNNVALPFLVNDRFNAGWMFVHRVYGIPADFILATFIAGMRPSFLAAPSSAGWKWIAAGAATMVTIAFAINSYPHGYRRQEMIADRVGRAFLDSLPPNAAVLPLDDFVYVLLYLTKVEKYRPDVVLLRKDFGYDSKKSYSSLYSMVPSSPAIERELSSLGKIRFVPQGLAYRIERINIASPPVDPRDFQEIAEPPAVPSPGILADDPFHRFARGLVSSYWAELGHKHWVEGDKDRAEADWDRAEQSADTAIAALRLVQIYEENNVRTDQQKKLLEQALALHDRYYDPAASRYLFVDRDEIRKKLSRREAGLP